MSLIFVENIEILIIHVMVRELLTNLTNVYCNNLKLTMTITTKTNISDDNILVTLYKVITLM